MVDAYQALQVIRSIIKCAAGRLLKVCSISLLLIARNSTKARDHQQTSAICRRMIRYVEFKGGKGGLLSDKRQCVKIITQI